jgi:hypothetical protein
MSRAHTQHCALAPRRLQASFIVNDFRARFAARRGRTCCSGSTAQAHQTFRACSGEFGSVGVMHLCLEAISPCSYSLP